MPTPPVELQTQIATFVEKVEMQKAQVNKSLALLELNYKSLMRKCFGVNYCLNKMIKKDLILGFFVLVFTVGLGLLVLYFMWQGILVVSAGVISLFQTISTLDTVIVVALFSSAVTVLGLVVNSVISICLKSSEYKNKIRDEMRKKMEQPYTKFVHIIFDMMMDTKDGKEIDEIELAKKINEFSKEVTLHGSNEMIKKWAAYRTSAIKLTPTENLIQMEGILYAIREDLGLKKKRMKTGDILALFVN